MFPGAHVGDAPDRPAVVMAATGWVQTYAELDAAANQLSRVLHDRHGDALDAGGRGYVERVRQATMRMSSSAMTTVLPASARPCRWRMRRSLSAGCRPAVGSSRT